MVVEGLALQAVVESPYEMMNSTQREVIRTLVGLATWFTLWPDRALGTIPQHQRSTAEPG